MTLAGLSEPVLEMLRDTMRERDSVFSRWLEGSIGEELERRHRNSLGDDKDLRAVTYSLPADLSLAETLSTMRRIYATLLALEALTTLSDTSEEKEQFEALTQFLGGLLSDLKHRQTVFGIFENCSARAIQAN